MNIGKAIALVRRAKKLKQYFLANKSGITKEYFSDIERNEKPPHYDTLQKICDALGVPIPVIYILASEEADWKNEEHSFLKEYRTITEFLINDKLITEKLSPPKIQKTKNIKKAPN